MHELSLCHSIHGIVARAAKDRGVTAVHLQVGQLRQVVPETLEYCWHLVTETSPLAGSRLVIDHVPVTVSCRTCGETTRLGQALLLVCAACGGGDIEVRTGEEFMVTTLDVAAPVPVDARAEDG